MDAATGQDRTQQGPDWQAISNVFEAADAGSPRILTPGVYKHRTVEEWNAQTALWEAGSVQRARARATQTPAVSKSGS